MRETHLLVLQKKEKLFLALSLAAVVLCTVLAFGFAVPLQAAEPQVLPDTTGLEQYVLVDLNTADLSALCTRAGRRGKARTDDSGLPDAEWPV